MEGCLACDLSDGLLPLPGGEIHATAHWRVEHCIGPLGVGTLLVKPKRHVLHVAELTGERGVGLQLAMFERGDLPDAEAVEVFAERARQSFTDGGP